MNKLLFKRNIKLTRVLKKSILTVIIVFTIVISLSFFASNDSTSVKADSDSDINQEYLSTNRDTTINIDQIGKTNIVRNRIKETSTISEDSDISLAFIEPVLEPVPMNLHYYYYE